jgi:hypothetical protein
MARVEKRIVGQERGHYGKNYGVIKKGCFKRYLTCLNSFICYEPILGGNILIMFFYLEQII